MPFLKTRFKTRSISILTVVSTVIPNLFFSSESFAMRGYLL